MPGSGFDVLTGSTVTITCDRWQTACWRVGPTLVGVPTGSKKPEPPTGDSAMQRTWGRKP